MKNGDKFGRWLVKEVYTNQNRKALCVCDCGKTAYVNRDNLTGGKSKSCGCMNRERMVECKTTHGMSNKPIYAVWRAIVQRCTLSTCKTFHYYGGRGIRVCDDWLKFEKFYADVGDPPYKGATLDRVDNDKGYCPDNVRWATRTEQARNKRTTARFTFQGKSLTLAEWSSILGINASTLASRLYTYKWPVEKALSVMTAQKERNYDVSKE